MMRSLIDLWNQFWGVQVPPVQDEHVPLLDAPLPKKKKRGRRGRGQHVQQPPSLRKKVRITVGEEGIRTLSIVSKRRRKQKQGSGGDAPSLKAESSEVIRDIEDFHALLSCSIDDLIPQEIDKECVRTILIWFWENEVIGGNCYISFSHLQKFVSKRRFLPKQFAESFSWLEEIGLILPHTGKSGARGRLIFLSLKNIRGDPGRVQELRGRIAKTFYDFDKAVGR